jgi:hypothetical protein
LSLPPSNTAYSTYQEKKSNLNGQWNINKPSTHLKTTSLAKLSLPTRTSPFLLKSTLTPPNTKWDPSLPKRTSHLHSIQGNLLSCLQ